MKMNVQERVMVETLRTTGKESKESRHKFERKFNEPGPTEKTIWICIINLKERDLLMMSQDLDVQVSLSML
jgi:hypothetical protein